MITEMERIKKTTQLTFVITEIFFIFVTRTKVLFQEIIFYNDKFFILNNNIFYQKSNSIYREKLHVLRIKNDTKKFCAIIKNRYTIIPSIPNTLKKTNATLPRTIPLYINIIKLKIHK